MLGTKADLKKTRFYKEIEEELLEAMIPMMLKAGISIEEIAQQSKISIQQVKAIAKKCKVKA
jgi:predicted transposase YdaD